MYVQGPVTNTILRDNRFYSSYTVGFSGADSALNTFLVSAPPDTVIVLPNVYEPGRAQIAVYNWTMKEYVPLDISGLLVPGDYFEIADAQNYFGPPVVSGMYGGGVVNIPMVGLTAVSPIGKPGSRSHTAPRFGAFVLLKGGVPSPLGVRDRPELPKGFALFQNYPNPFNPSTTIRYALAHGGDVVLRVITLLGQEVARLVDRPQVAGEHAAVFDGNGRATGVYFYELRVGAEREVRKMVLVK
jgi:hypothetical protein